MISPSALAVQQLWREKGRLLVALAGTAFAVLLMFMQIGFMDALFRSAVALHRHLRAEIVLVHPNYNLLGYPTEFPRRRLYQALGFDGVARVTGLYTSLARWKNPWTGRSRDLFLIGVDPDSDALTIPGVSAQQELLRRPDSVLFDAMSRPEFGPVAATLAAGRPVVTELSGRRVTVAGVFELGTTIGIDATVITSDLNFRRIVPGRAAGAVGIGLVELRPGVDAEALCRRLRAALPGDVMVMTRSQFIAYELSFWRTRTPIGFVFTFGVAMGVVVGAIIVYQILFADITDHLGEYATLAAMGYSRAYLAAVVLVEATLLAAVGYLPGAAISNWLYGAAGAATKLPMRLTADRVALVLGLTLVMCWVSALIAVRRLRSASPADVF